MKLVLDYIYGGAMYLCGAHMQYVIQVASLNTLEKELVSIILLHPGDGGVAVEVWGVCQQDGQGD